MDDEEETYRLWKIRKTIMQVSARGVPSLARAVRADLSGSVVSPREAGKRGREFGVCVRDARCLFVSGSCPRKERLNL